MKSENIKNDAIVNVRMPVSTKYTMNIGRWIKGENVDKAIVKLEKVMKKELALPIVTHKMDTPHRRGMAAGRYPVKTADYVIQALKSVKSNAKNKGLDETKLIVNEFMPNYAYSAHQRGSYKRGRMTTLKIGVVVEK